jgi:stage V sporulation protein B
MGGSKRSDISTGGPFLAGAKLYFLVAAYATTLALTRLIDPATLGQYNVVARIIAVPNMILIQTLMFSVSRPMAEQFGDGTPGYRSLRRRGFMLAGLLGGLASLVFLVGAPAIAWSLNDDALTEPFRYVAPISCIYAFYAVNLGTVNATRRFSWQAAMDVFMATAKASLIIVAAVLGLGLAVTLGGFTVAASLALVLSVFVVIRNRPPGVMELDEPAPPMAGFVVILVVFTGLTNLLLALDVSVLKHFATTDAMRDAVGFYSSAQLVALVPYSLLAAVSLIMFPLIASLSASDDHETIRRYVTETVKVVEFLLALMASVCASAAPEVQALLFPTAYGSAAEDLRWLVWGYSGYSLTVTMAWIFNSSSRSRMALALVGVVVVTVGVGSVVLVPTMADLGAARAVAIAGGVGGIASLIAVWRYFGASMPLGFALKLALAIGLTSTLGWYWEADGKIMILAKLVALTIVFVGTALATRAVTRRQIEDLRRAG